MISSLLLALAAQAGANAPIPAAVAVPPAPPAAASGAPVSAQPPPSPAPPASRAPSGRSDPRRIDDLAHPLTGAVPQGSYEAGVKGAFSRTQSLQGPLDGTWTLKDAGGGDLYRVQLIDAGAGTGRLDGAWSDVRGGGVSASGFLAAATRDGARLTLQFAEPGSGMFIASLDARRAGGFAGELSQSEAGKAASTAPVTLVRP